MKKYTIAFLLLLFAVFFTFPAFADSDLAEKQDSWRFLTLADWHWAEKYVFPNTDWVAPLAAEDVAAVKMLKKNYGGDLIMLPGDSNDGHWDRPKFIKRFEPGLSPEEAILKAGKLCYTGMINSFKAGGYDRLLMAVGDHEMGDNPWPVNSAVSRCQPQFKEIFSKVWNTSPDGGGFLYDRPIGHVPSRPLGTPFEGTSYAYRYRNVLFVTVDVFYQEDPSKEIGEEGTVTGAVTGKHLEWLDAVLSEARKDDSIKHIFVQGHLPVIYPVRKVSSSGMLMDHGENSEFWKTLRRHNVDIYFAGEVHANTVTKDSQSSLLQIVSRGNFFDNFLTVDVQDEQIDITLYDQIGAKASDGQYQTTGALRIDKTGGKTRIDASGELALLDPAARQFHFDFETQVLLAELPIAGMPPWRKQETEVRGIHCDSVLIDSGALSGQYNALSANMDIVPGKFGQAAVFGKDSRMAVWAMGPFQAGHALSCSVWIKTTSFGNSVLINTASIWKAGKGFFNLQLNNGVPEIVISMNDALIAQDIRLNNGQWHHLAAVMPRDNCALSEVHLFADGRELETGLRGADRPIYLDQAIRVSFGSLAYSRPEYDSLAEDPYIGEMDEVSLWARSLAADEIKALAGQ